MSIDQRSPDFDFFESPDLEPRSGRDFGPEGVPIIALITAERLNERRRVRRELSLISSINDVHASAHTQAVLPEVRFAFNETFTPAERARAHQLASRNERAEESIPETHEIFETRRDVIRALVRQNRENRQVLKAYYLDIERAEQWDTTVDMSDCSDGRNSAARSFEDEAKIHYMYAHEYAPQAGHLMIRGVPELHSVEELNAFYEGTGDIFPGKSNKDAINEILHNRYTKRIRRRFALKQKLVKRLSHGGTPGTEAQRIAQKRYRIELKSHSHHSSYLPIIASIGISGAEGETPLDSFLPPEGNETARTLIQSCAEHGCGAHDSSMDQALEQTAKIAYILQRWLRDTHIDPKTGSDAPNFTDDDLSFIEVVRTHITTGDGWVRLASEYDDKALRLKNGQISLTAIPEDLRAAIGPCAPSSPRWKPHQLQRKNKLYPHTVTEHDEQLIILSNNHRTFLIPKQSALKQIYAPDVVYTGKVNVKLFGIAGGPAGFAKHHPGKPLFFIADCPEEPLEDVVDVLWADTPEAESLQEQFHMGDGIPLDFVKEIIDWDERGEPVYALTLKNEPIPAEEVQARLTQNAKMLRKREAILAQMHADLELPGNEHLRDTLQIIKTTQNARNGKLRFDDPEDQRIANELEAEMRAEERALWKKRRKHPRA